MKDFGVIVTCSKNDFLFAKGCCSSIRYFLGDVPICLLVDGDVPIDSIAKHYNTFILSKENIKNQLLISRSFGWGLTKMIAFWESPFEHFLLLDADTCLWGDVSTYADFNNYDVVLDIPCYNYTEKNISEYFFDTSMIRELFPAFNYHVHQYICTGVIFGKKDLFDINEYTDILDLNYKYPDLFKYGEMGFLNFMLFRAKQEERLKIGTQNIQYIVADFPFADTKEAFAIDKEPVLNNNPTVIHWAGGGKPVKSNPHVYGDPMTYFRKMFLKDKGFSNTVSNIILAKEDYLREFQLQSKYYKKRIKQILE